MAVKLGEEALVLHGQGRFKEAYERFETAEKIAHSPVFVLWMARSKRGLGELRAAEKLYEKVASEDLAAAPTPKWTAAQNDAKREHEALAKRIPRVRIAVQGAPAGASLAIDGNAALPEVEVEVDPGDHVARATAAGGGQASKTFHADEGDAPARITLVLPVSPVASETRGPLAPGGITLGIGGAALIAGAVTGGYALALAKQVNAGCIRNLCQAADATKGNLANALAYASTGLFIAGGVASAVGIALLVTRPRFGGSRGPTAKTSVSIGVRPRGVAVGFSF
jgi:hypothetical protein